MENYERYMLRTDITVSRNKIVSGGAVTNATNGGPTSDSSDIFGPSPSPSPFHLLKKKPAAMLLLKEDGPVSTLTLFNRMKERGHVVKTCSALRTMLSTDPDFTRRDGKWHITSRLPSA